MHRIGSYPRQKTAFLLPSCVGASSSTPSPMGQQSHSICSSRTSGVMSISSKYAIMTFRGNQDGFPSRSCQRCSHADSNLSFSTDVIEDLMYRSKKSAIASMSHFDAGWPRHLHAAHTPSGSQLRRLWLGRAYQLRPAGSRGPPRGRPGRDAFTDRPSSQLLPRLSVMTERSNVVAGKNDFGLSIGPN